MPIVAQDIDCILSADLPWQDFSGAHILITGANGFIATYLVRALLALNDKEKLKAPLHILALVRNPERAEKHLGPLLKRKDITLISHDMGLPFAWDGRIDFIIHAASQASPKYYNVDPVGTIAPNIFGTNSLLTLAKDKKVKAFLMFSSSDVYGEVAPENIPTREDQYGYLDPLKFRSCYAASKRMAETMCISWSHQHHIPVKIVRPFHTYGPGMALDDGRIFADFVADILSKRNLVIKSDGLAARAFCYLADAVSGYFYVLLKGENGSAYNVGNDKAYMSIGELAKKLVTEFSELNLSVIFDTQPRGKDYVPSPVSKVCPNISFIKTLGWKPLTDVREGFRRTVTSFQEN